MISIQNFMPSSVAYDAIAAVRNAAWPDEPQVSGSILQAHDQEWPAHAAMQRLIAVHTSGHIIGEGIAYETYWRQQHGVVQLDFSVLPDTDQQIESQLYAALEAAAQRLVPGLTMLASSAREDQTTRIALLTRQHFIPVMRTLISALALDSVDMSPYTMLHSKLREQHISIRSLTELQAHTPDWKQRLYELRWALIQDVPAVTPPAWISMEEFETRTFRNPAFYPQGWFLALDESQSGTSAETAPFIGLCNLRNNDPSGHYLDNGLTGVLRPYRRRGIATALKLTAIRFAQQRGCQKIITGNEEHNPMYHLNKQLGFRPMPAWVSYRKTFARSS